MNYALAILGVLLALSVAGNAFLFHERDKIMQKEATVSQLAADVKQQAAVCTASVDNLAEEGKKRDAHLGAKLDAIAPKVAELQKEQFAALSARPDNPHDLCGSLARYWSQEIAKEKGGQP